MIEDANAAAMLAQQTALDRFVAYCVPDLCSHEGHAEDGPIDLGGDR